MLAIEFIHVCTYTSYFQIAQAHGGTLWGLLCDQFSSQPHPLFPFPNSHWMRVSETTCSSALIKLVKHTVHLRWWSRVLWPRPVQKGFSKSPDHPIFKRQEMNEAATSPKESPHPSFQPKYFVLCLCLLVYTSLHICILDCQIPRSA